MPDRSARREKMMTLKRGEWPFCAGHSRYFMALLQILCGTPGAHRAINHFATTCTAPGESPVSMPPRRGGDGGGGDLCARIARTG